MTHMNRCFLLVPAFVLLMSLASGQTAHAQVVLFGTDMGLGGVGLNESEVAPQGLDTHAVTFGMTGYMILGRYARIGVGMLLFAPSDSHSFDVRVVDENGTESTATASASVVGFFGEVGLTVPLADKARIEVNLGAMGTSASRSVGDCSDCPSESLNVPAGTYIKPRLMLQVTPRVTLGGEYQQFFSGSGTTRGFQVFIGYQWQRKRPVAADRK